MGAVLNVAGVRHRRGGREVLRVECLDVAAGERLGLLGLNGAGKTSLLRLLAAIDQPTVGEVRVNDVPTSHGGPALRRRVAYAPQRPVLLSTTVRHNVELPLRYRRVPRATRQTVAAAALARLGVEHLADRSAHSLSGGEAQRVSLARALACEPDALLLDEPAAGLDTTGPGHHKLTLNAGLALQAHTPLTPPPPDRGTEVSLEIDLTQTALLDPPPRSPISGQERTPPPRA